MASFLIAANAWMPYRVWAKLCGDDVGGKDVPCACGDTVVSNLRLADDPLLSATCPSDGLIVRAPNAAAALRIDLAGHRLRGSGGGVGIWVLHGGPGGASIVSSGKTATIEGFRDGVVARGTDSVALIEGLAVRASSRDGLRFSGIAGTKVRNCDTTDSGRDGFSIDGKGFRLANTRSQGSHRFGYRLSGKGATIGAPGAGNVAADSGHTGFLITGEGFSITDCIARRSQRDGLRIRGSNHELRGCRARENGGDGITGTGRRWRLARNSAIANGGDGMVVDGKDIVDLGGNSGSGNRGGGHNRPVVHCALAKRACRK